MYNDTMESTRMFSLRMVFFYLVATGWILTLAYLVCNNSVNQSNQTNVSARRYVVRIFLVEVRTCVQKVLLRACVCGK